MHKNKQLIGESKNLLIFPLIQVLVLFFLYSLIPKIRQGISIMTKNIPYKIGSKHLFK